MTQLQWISNDALAMRQEVQTPNDDGGLDVELQGEVVLPAEGWLDHVAAILDMLLGKPNADKDGYLLGPVGADPGLVGALIASKIQGQRDSRSAPPN